MLTNSATDDLAGAPFTLARAAQNVQPGAATAARGEFDAFVARCELGRILVTNRSASPWAVSITLSGESHVYAFPRSNSRVELHSIQVSSGAETTGDLTYGGTVARVHPAGDRMYGAIRGLSPADIERYDITQGTAALAYDSPYHGDYEMCGDLWFSQDGALIFTACGNVFHASNVRSQDMTYSGALAGASNIRQLDHSGAAHLVATVHGGARGPVRFDSAAPSLREVQQGGHQALRAVRSCRDAASEQQRSHGARAG